MQHGENGICCFKSNTRLEKQNFILCLCKLTQSKDNTSKFKKPHFVFAFEVTGVIFCSEEFFVFNIQLLTFARFFWMLNKRFMNIV